MASTIEAHALLWAILFGHSAGVYTFSSTAARPGTQVQPEIPRKRDLACFHVRINQALTACGFTSELDMRSPDTDVGTASALFTSTLGLCQRQQPGVGRVTLP